MTQKEIEALLACYFGDALQECRVTLAGKIVNVKVVYEDFKPLREVRRWLGAAVPMLEVCDVERVFSNESMSKEFLNLLDEDTFVWVEDETDALRKVRLAVFVEERLFGKTIGK